MRIIDHIRHTRRQSIHTALQLLSTHIQAQQRLLSQRFSATNNKFAKPPSAPRPPSLHLPPSSARPRQGMMIVCTWYLCPSTRQKYTAKQSFSPQLLAGAQEKKTDKYQRKKKKSFVKHGGHRREPTDRPELKHQRPHWPCKHERVYVMWAEPTASTAGEERKTDKGNVARIALPHSAAFSLRDVF